MPALKYNKKIAYNKTHRSKIHSKANVLKIELYIKALQFIRWDGLLCLNRWVLSLYWNRLTDVVLRRLWKSKVWGRLWSVNNHSSASEWNSLQCKSPPTHLPPSACAPRCPGLPCLLHSQSTYKNFTIENFIHLFVVIVSHGVESATVWLSVRRPRLLCEGFCRGSTFLWKHATCTNESNSPIGGRLLNLWAWASSTQTHRNAHAKDETGKISWGWSACSLWHQPVWLLTKWSCS